MDRIDLESLSTASIIILLKLLQKQFDAGKDGGIMLELFQEHRRAMAMLGRRGLSEEKIAWLLGQDSAPS